MILATSIKRYLETAGVSYKVHPHRREECLRVLERELGLDARYIAVPTLLRSDKNGLLMTVTPLTHELDVNRLNGMLRRQFNVVTDTETLSEWFDDVEPGAYPPLGGAYKIPLIIDKNLMTNQRVFFKCGSHNSLVSLDGEDFQFLCTSAPKATISNPRVVDEQLDIPVVQEGAQHSTVEEIKEKLLRVNRLPAMPPMAYQIIHLVNDPETTAEQLSEVVELDPSIAMQVMRYAGSPYYGYSGKINSVQDAITRVLGFDLVSNIALGIASSKVFNIDKEGPLGLKAFWRHALYSAMLSQAIARKVGDSGRVNPSLAYLGGLLHNMGVLLIGHLFPPEFNMLNKLVETHPTESLHVLEKRIIGLGQAQQVIALGHSQVGSWLMESWNMPGEVVACCDHHHDRDYSGQHCDYVKIIQISNQLLAREGIGDCGVFASEVMPGGSLEAFNLLTIKELDELFMNVMEMCGEIDDLAGRMAA
ncbi:MAG: hypothetical protein COA99_14705 [Moraxellaceae bacterium]|nr:MAG: hypothetical protein COA99_14705 [Moraxellaceae bacterium]